MIDLLATSESLLLHPLWIALGVPLLLIGLFLRRRRGEPALAFGPASLVSNSDSSSVRTRFRLLPQILEALGVLAALYALARPVERIPIDDPVRGIDILLGIDVSSSMAANDLDPRSTRLDVVKAAARDFIRARPKDAIGLLAFARFPDLKCPPTLDHKALLELLDRLELVDNDGPEDQTGIGLAVASLAATLRTSSAVSRLAVLLTDGEENVATAETPGEIAPQHGAQLCRELKIRCHTIAAGRGRRGPGGTLLPLDTTALRGIAERTEGTFFEAQDRTALEAVYRDIDKLETTPRAETRFRMKERFFPYVAAALALFVLGQMLRLFRFEAAP